MIYGMVLASLIHANFDVDIGTDHEDVSSAAVNGECFA